MNIAITSQGNTLDSKLDKSFGRCNYFVIYNLENKSLEFMPNQYKDAETAAGSKSVELLISKNVKKIISGDFGIKIKPILENMKIQMIALKNSEKTIKQIIELLNH